MPRVSVKHLTYLGLLVILVSMSGCPPAGPGPEAGFNAAPRVGGAPLTVRFTDTSLPGASTIRAWAWNFGNGETSTNPNPTMTYLLPGKYTVSLTVTTAYGNDTLTVPNYIEVTESSTYLGIGAAGGTIAARGISITVRPNVFEEEVMFGIGENSQGLLMNAFEPIQLVSSVYTITHNNSTDRMFGSVLGDAVQPATLVLPFIPELVPAADRVSEKVQILAMTKEGLSIPIVGRIENSTVVAQVMRLPAKAEYVVVYRPEGRMLMTAMPAETKAATAYLWKQNWNIYFSATLLRQLTAIRLGNIDKPQPYERNDFSEEEMAVTLTELVSAMESTNTAAMGAGLRSPALVNDGNAYTLAFYDLDDQYFSNYGNFRNLTYRTQLFGSVVIDPRQLLMIALHNANAVAADSDLVDLAQELTPANAFMQELFEACFKGYDYPEITIPSAADGYVGGVATPIHFMAGVEQGVATMLGQWAQWPEQRGIPLAGYLYVYFDEVDTDHSGALSFAESRPYIPTLIESDFRRIDLDRNTVLDEEELTDGLTILDRSQLSVLAALLDHFEALDAHNDGLSYAETQAIPDVLLGSYDANDDQQVQRNELEDTLANGLEDDEDMIAGLLEHFAALDTNGNGGLSYAEARVQYPGMTEQTFTRLDLNADGVLKRFEMMAPARGFGSNEYALLSNQLLLPVDYMLPAYSVASQEFFFYTQRSQQVQDQPFAYIMSHTPLSRGILEEVRATFDALPDRGTTLDSDEVYRYTAESVDRALTSNLQMPLAEAYWAYLLDRAYINSPMALLRPSDEVRDPYTFNEDRFTKDAVITLSLLAPTDKIELAPDAVAALTGIPPLSARVIVLNVNPLAHTLALQFNPEDWKVDDAGNSVAVAVFREGMQGDELSAIGIDTDEDGLKDTMPLTGFQPDPEDCSAKVIILLSNLNLSHTNSVGMKAESFAEKPVADTAVLDTYVASCDPSYNYELEMTSSVPSVGITSYLINMTSGAWRGAADVDQVVWQHYVTIIEPPVIASTTALLMVSGGSTGSQPSLAYAELMAPFSLSTGTVVALIQAVPNQPLLFAGETATRSEDAIIAHSYDQYMTGYEEEAADMTWPALLPMTRAAVRAMDTIQQFMALEKPGAAVVIENFVVTGASKRGWTTWLTAAADKRVTAIMPIVIDVLNMDEQMDHQFKAYGEYSSAVQDYVDAEVFDRLGTPAGASLLKIVDPYEYRSRLTMPKMIVNSTGDQFFLPDSSQFYMRRANASQNIPGSNYLYYAPNTDHSLSSGDQISVDLGAYNSLLAFYNSFVREVNRPVFDWTVDGNQIVLTTETKPKMVKLWQASNRTSRDFRLETIGEDWTSTVLCTACIEDEEEGEICEGGTTEGETEGEGAISPCESGVYVGEVPVPAEGDGWTAFFLQMIYPGPDANLSDVDFGFSTQVVVIPDTYPVSQSR
ncbi:MAG TPA: PhoPQ-activated protein PqaA family protein [Candidatus Hydrogenedentes bacterium]|nr:PhoPQ-activated protein PqaA family protein [Candidatus Hydrogenedentota bacterium]